MKGAKELADRLRSTIAQPVTFVESGWLVGLAHATVEQLIVHLDAKAAIDSAVTGDAKEIERLHANDDAGVNVSPEWVIKRDFAEARKHRATLLAIVQRQAGDAQAALNLARGYEQERDAARAEVERLKSERSSLAAENARLVNEHAAAMSRADVLAEGVRLLAACANIRAHEYETYQEWRSKHGHMVNK